MVAHGRTRSRSRSTVALTLAGALSLLASTAFASCAAREPSSPDAAPTPTAETIGTSPPTSPSPSGTDSAPIGVPQLRVDDSGSRLSLRVEQTAVILLPGETWSWTDPTVDGTAVTVSEDISDEASSTRSWTVTAREPGTATIHTAGSPTCRSSTPPCDSPELRWEVRITVS